MKARRDLRMNDALLMLTGGRPDLFPAPSAWPHHSATPGRPPFDPWQRPELLDLVRSQHRFDFLPKLILRANKLIAQIVLERTGASLPLLQNRVDLQLLIGRQVKSGLENVS